MSLKTDLVIVWIKSGVPTEEEAEAINAMEGVPRTMNAKFFRATESERIKNCSVVNLTGRKEIDEFYAKQLLNAPKQKEVEPNQPEEKPKQGRRRRASADVVIPSGDNVMPDDVNVDEPKARPKPQATKD